jgi:hypothetical protein
MTELIDPPPDTAITVRFGLVDEPAIGLPLILWLVASAARVSHALVHTIVKNRSLTFPSTLR